MISEQLYNTLIFVVPLVMMLVIFYVMVRLSQHVPIESDYESDEYPDVPKVIEYDSNVKTWECTYCGALNDSGVVCNNCKAPKKNMRMARQ